MRKKIIEVMFIIFISVLLVNVLPDWLRGLAKALRSENHEQTTNESIVANFGYEPIKIGMTKQEILNTKTCSFMEDDYGVFCKDFNFEGRSAKLWASWMPAKGTGMHNRIDNIMIKTDGASFPAVRRKLTRDCGDAVARPAGHPSYTEELFCDGHVRLKSQMYDNGDMRMKLEFREGGFY